ncbi:hypothetical protein J7E23_14960 [Pseudomonas sp. ISL-88]|uniref:hypothetical protein n=1 Tax=Pseudomonas sp. ISL-88 TaxID=2819169 RepID=UPI001BE5505E|nr:hypothetical protein [Pseudomonas sp. ISL-88]MBT2714128.1 hypothetical protein [Pseudomonas sp. ISL-88]
MKAVQVRRAYDLVITEAEKPAVIQADDVLVQVNGWEFAVQICIFIMAQIHWLHCRESLGMK